MAVEDASALSEIRERMVRVETKLDELKDDMKSAAEARDIARDALQNAKSAHHRLDRSKAIKPGSGAPWPGPLFLARSAPISNLEADSK